MKKAVNIIIFGLLLLIFGSYMFTYQVRQDEIAFVNTLGKDSDPIEKPVLNSNCRGRLGEASTNSTSGFMSKPRGTIR